MAGSVSNRGGRLAGGDGRLLPSLAPCLRSSGAWRRMFDLDVVPEVINAQLSQDPLMAQLVGPPCLRLFGTWDGLNWRFVQCWASRSPWWRRFVWRASWWRSMARRCKPRTLVSLTCFRHPKCWRRRTWLPWACPRRGGVPCPVAQALLDDPQLFQPKASLRTAWHGWWRCRGSESGPRSTSPCASCARRMRLRRGHRADQCFGGFGRWAGVGPAVIGAGRGVAAVEGVCGAAFVDVVEPQ